jgi:hypothetical protein
MKGKFKKKLVNSNEFKEVCFILLHLSVILIILNARTIHATPLNLNSVIFSDTSLVAAQSLFSTNVSIIDNLLSNASLFLYEATTATNTTTANCVSLYSLIVTHSNYTLNSLETKRKYFQCEEILELFCNQQLSNKTIFSHSLMDCEDILKASNQTQLLTASNDNDASGATTLISLSPSSSQVTACIYALMSAFSISKYAIVFSDDLPSSSYAQMASNIVYKLSKMNKSFSLEFSLGLSDATLNNFLSNSFNESTVPGKLYYVNFFYRDRT